MVLVLRDHFVGVWFRCVGFASLPRRKSRGTRRETWVYVYMCVCECVRVCRRGVGEVFIVIVWPTRYVPSHTHSSVPTAFSFTVPPHTFRLLPRYPPHCLSTHRLQDLFLLFYFPITSSSSFCVFLRTFFFVLITFSFLSLLIYPLCVHVPFSSSLSLSSAFLPCGLFSYFSYIFPSDVSPRFSTWSVDILYYLRSLPLPTLSFADLPNPFHFFLIIYLILY